MHFTINVVEPAATPDTFIVRGALTAHMTVLVDASNDTVSATVKPSDVGIQCDATKESVATAIANAVALAGVANVQRLERQGIPCPAPAPKPAPVSDAESASAQSAVSAAPPSPLTPEPLSPPAPAAVPVSPKATAAAPAV